MKGARIIYSADEMAWLEANRTLAISDYHRCFVARFGRSDISAANLHALRKRRGWKTGRTGRFENGADPFNKGKTCPPGTGGRHPNAQKTQFRKGQRSGVAKHVYQPIGAERISKDGYRERKVNDGLPMQARWQSVQRIEWEKINGPVPAGMCLKCRDGNKQNTDPSNWEAIPRGVLPLLSARFGMRYDQAEPEVKPVIMTVARLKHAARSARQRRKDASEGLSAGRTIAEGAKP
jgi:hypothetical protein